MDDVPEKKNRQVATRTTPQVTRVQTDGWTDRSGYKTEKLEQLADQLKVAQTISNGRIEQSAPQEGQQCRQIMFKM
jgi:hypothetical protein